MGLRVSEAKKVGRYIEKLYEEMERSRETGEITGDLAEDPEKVIRILQSISIPKLIEVAFFTFTLIASEKEKHGDDEIAKELRRELLAYASRIQFFLELYKQQIGGPNFREVN